jgi:hypothetical protein
MTLDSIMKNWLDKLLPNRAAPVLGRVIKIHEGPGKNKYSVDVQIVRAGTLEETEQIIAEVPISPLWVSRKKRGVYAVPPVDSLVVVGFLEWNSAFPYIEGVYSDEYEADAFANGHFVITDGNGFRLDFTEGNFTLTDGKGMVFEFTEGSLSISDKNGAEIGIDKDSLLLIKSKEQTLRAILEKLVNKTAGIKTMGGPPQHAVSPDSQEALVAIKRDIAQLFKE